MNTEEIKNSLYEGIENIEDDDFLLEIKALIMKKHNPSDFPKLSELQIERIKDSENQIENGDFFTNEQADKIIDKWLEE